MNKKNLGTLLYVLNKLLKQLHNITIVKPDGTENKIYEILRIQGVGA
jgi:hypothetical protein